MAWPEKGAEVHAAVEWEVGVPNGRERRDLRLCGKERGKCQNADESGILEHIYRDWDELFDDCSFVLFSSAAL